MGERDLRYINQYDYDNIPYPVNLDEPTDQWGRNATIADAGCGLCSACMMVDRLTFESLGVEECRDLSAAAGANRKVGTDMTILAPVLAERYHLKLEQTDDVDAMRCCLQTGGCVIINVGGDREGHTGIFSHGGHYIVGISVREDVFCLLDPSWRLEKYSEPGREAVRQKGQWLYAPKKALQEDTANRSPAYYLFWRE